MNGWNDKRRRKQERLIRQWKPWEKSTGPITTEGKSRSSRNAMKHGLRSREILETSRILAEMRRQTIHVSSNLDSAQVNRQGRNRK